MTAVMSRAEVLAVVGAAQASGEPANLSEANLSEANLYGADLSRADLSRANLSEANLYGANLSRADLSRDNLYGARWDGLVLDGLPSGRALLTPTPEGWVLRVGCEPGTVQHLRDIIAGDDWPSGCGEAERERRRPVLALVADLADAWIAAHPETVPDLAKRWLK